MLRVRLIVSLCLSLFAQAAIGGGDASADGNSTQRVNRFVPAPIVSVAVDPSNFDPSAADEQIKRIKKRLEEIENTILPPIYRSHDEKTRITDLRDVLREIVQHKLALTSIDGSLSKSRDDEIREAAIARQILGSRPNIYNFQTSNQSYVGPNTSSDRIQQKLDADLNQGDWVRKQIDQERLLLHSLGGAHSDRLQLLGNQASDFYEKSPQDKIDGVRDQVRSALGLPQIASDVTPSPPSIIQPPRPKALPVPKESGADPVTVPQSDNADGQSTGVQKDEKDVKDKQEAKSDDKVEALVDAILRLNKYIGQAEGLHSQIDDEQALLDDRKRVEGYRQVDRNIGNLRDQIAQLQAKITSLQDGINQAIDTAVNQIGGREWFTQLATWIFGIAVVIVIGSFFGLAFRDKENRLLSNPDIGLQFVTLFAIIIAIILFGILNILGSKELSALLGGISGYILGRGTLGSNGRRSDSHSCPNHRHPVEEASAGTAPR